MSAADELTILDVLFLDDNGRPACYSHAGQYLRSELRNRPTVRVNSVVFTPHASWLVVDRRVCHLEGLDCETCRPVTP